MASPERLSLRTQLARSAAVLARPSQTTFAAAVDGATFLAAGRYVALAAAVAALIALPTGASVSLGIFLSNLLGFAGFVWLIHRVGTSGRAAVPLAPISYAVALFWSPLAVVSSLVITVLLWAGVGVGLAPFVAGAALLTDLVLTYLALGATNPQTTLAGRVVLVVAGGLAAYGIDRFVWLLVG